MILETLFIYGTGFVVSATGAYLVYQHVVSYHTKLSELNALKNEAERAAALGITTAEQDTDDPSSQTITETIRLEEVKALAESLSKTSTIMSDRKSSLHLLIQHADVYHSLFEFEIALMKKIVDESSYFFTNPAHEECIKIITKDPRYNLLGVNYYVNFSNSLHARLQQHQVADQDINFIDNLQTSLTASESSVTQLTVEVEQLTKQLTEYNQRYVQLNQQYKDSYDRNGRLSQALADEKTKHNTTRESFKQCQQQLFVTQQHLVTLSKQIETLQNELENKNVEISTLKKSIIEITEQATKTRALCDHLEQKLTERKRNEVSLEARIKRLEMRADITSQPETNQFSDTYQYQAKV